MQDNGATEWVDYFIRTGHAEARLLGSGMEGTVYRLGDGQVGKVWARRSPENLLLLRQFYSDLESANIGVTTPLIYEVRSAEGRTITIERELLGRPLQELLLDAARAVPHEAAECLATVLRGLSKVAATPAMRALAVLDEPDALWAGRETWSDSVVALMRRRVELFGDQLRARVRDFDSCYEGLVGRVIALPATQLSALHGDLCGANILVDERHRAAAVLDFGFLSTAGDPAFDMAIAAGIHNMYGPHARELCRELTVWLARDAGYPVEILHLYQAVYAVISSNAYDALGCDGHFDWCVAILQSKETEALAR